MLTIRFVSQSEVAIHPLISPLLGWRIAALLVGRWLALRLASDQLGFCAAHQVIRLPTPFPEPIQDPARHAA